MDFIYIYHRITEIFSCYIFPLYSKGRFWLVWEFGVFFLIKNGYIFFAWAKHSDPLSDISSFPRNLVIGALQQKISLSFKCSWIKCCSSTWDLDCVRGWYNFPQRETEAGSREARCIRGHRAEGDRATGVGGSLARQLGPPSTPL